MVADLENQELEAETKMASLQHDFRKKSDTLLLAESNLEEEMQQNQKRLASVERMQFEVQHSQHEILPEYEQAKIKSRKAAEEAKSKIDEAVAFHRALVAQTSSAKSCVADLLALSKIYDDNLLS